MRLNFPPIWAGAGGGGGGGGGGVSGVGIGMPVGFPFASYPPESGVDGASVAALLSPPRSLASLASLTFSSAAFNSSSAAFFASSPVAVSILTLAARASISASFRSASRFCSSFLPWRSASNFFFAAPAPGNKLVRVSTVSANQAVAAVAGSTPRRTKSCMFCMDFCCVWARSTCRCCSALRALPPWVPMALRFLSSSAACLANPPLAWPAFSAISPPKSLNVLL